MPLMKFLSRFWVPNPSPMARAPPRKAKTVSGILTDARLKMTRAMMIATRAQRRIKFAWLGSTCRRRTAIRSSQLASRIESQ